MRTRQKGLWGSAIVLMTLLVSVACTPVASGPKYVLLLHDPIHNKFSIPTTVPSAGGSTLDIVQPLAPNVTTSVISTARRVTVGGIAVPFEFVSPDRSAGGSSTKGLYNQYGNLALTLPPHKAGTVSVVVTGPGFTSSPMALKYGGKGPAYGLRTYDAARNTFPAVTSVPASGGSTIAVVQQPSSGLTASALSLARKVLVGGVAVPFRVIPSPQAAGGGTSTKGLYNNLGNLLLTLPPHKAGRVSVVVVEPGFTSSPLPLTYAGSGPAYELRLYDAVRNTFPAPTTVPTAGGSTLAIVQRASSTVTTSALSLATKVIVGGISVPFTFKAPPPQTGGTGAGSGKGIFNQFGNLTLTLPPHSAGTVSVVVVEPGFTSSPLPLKYG